ncbi:MATE family efflux transporter [Clostridium intestinale]|uniref:Multidrug export protein MepA n=1 Tax=Clostridium intestinale TaxID=36845 RepID=A0A7D6ZYF3_9CLOT|nr:MATE family efflux transporter [Clostridium intestinale]QLY80382.1 MATE family efflux transporter [Clostridium intestinale]
MNKINDLEEKPVSKLLAQYAIPATLSLVVNALYQMVDRIYIGHIPEVGVLGLSGVGLTAPITTIIIALSALFAFGAASTISIRLGEGNKEEAERAAGNAITYVLISSVVITALFFLLRPQIFEVLKITGQSTLYAVEYINTIVIGTVFSMFSFVFPIIIRSDGSPAFSMVTTLVGCVLNIILDAIFIFGLGMGIQGAAVATVISQAVSTALGLFYFINGKPTLHISRKTMRPDTGTLKSIIKIGSIPCANQLSVSVAQLIGNYALVQYGGEVYVGAMTAIRSVFQLFMMGVYGLGQGVQPIVGYNFAKKSYKRAFDTLKLSFTWDMGILVLGFILAQLLPQFWIKLFIKDQAIAAIAADGLLKFTILLPLASFVAVGSGFMMMTDKIKAAIFLNISYQILISATTIYFLPLLIGTDGLWYSQPLTDVIATVLTIILFIRSYGSIIKQMRLNR